MEELPKAAFLVLPEDWQPEEVQAGAELTFVVHMSGGVPLRLGRVEGSPGGPEVARIGEEGEELRAVRVEVPSGVHDLYFARAGAVLLEGERASLITAPHAFESADDVVSAISSPGFRLLAAYEPIQGPPMPIDPRRYEWRECPGPPRHPARVLRDNPICDVHHVEAQPA